LFWLQFNNHFNNPLSRTFEATGESQVQENVRSFRPPAPLVNSAAYPSIYLHFFV
jgi:hypothetical protein